MPKPLLSYRFGDRICDLHDGLLPQILPKNLEVVKTLVINIPGGSETITNAVRFQLGKDSTYQYLNKLLVPIAEDVEGNIIAAASIDDCRIVYLTLRDRDDV